jgi:hypothetical protein
LLSKGSKPSFKAVRFAISWSVRLIPLTRRAMRNAPKNQTRSRSIGPPNEASNCFTCWMVGTPPPSPFIVLSAFQSSG